MALRDGQDLRELDEEESYGFGVDGGMASLLDEAAFPVTEASDNADAWFDDPGHASLTLPGLDANVIATTTAMGDGGYPTWIGRTTTGDVTCVVSGSQTDPQGGTFSISGSVIGTIS
jgi:hypothetical protein